MPLSKEKKKVRKIEILTTFGDLVISYKYKRLLNLITELFVERRNY